MLCAMGKKFKNKKKNINKYKKMVVEKNNIHKNYVFIQRLVYKKNIKLCGRDSTPNGRASIYKGGI